MTWTRRRVLQTALAAGGGFVLPYGRVWSQDKAAALLRAPKQALVIGNSNYRHAPLKNPANDARAMAGTLKGVGFDTVVGLDWKRSEMDNAIRTFAERLDKSKAVGLFYFAGHGAQLAWRNYAVPVDAEIESIDELRARCVDVNSVVDGMRRAGNPMNLIILDACRDNPAGGRVRPDQRGLSQIDAPSGTLLAYATAPGNTAIDGDGEHGLYTEHLLREIKVPEAKVEDVFKRVRLGVRRRSNGQQVPWESTSLEEDFWFVPPQVLKKAAEEEIEREFRAELALWERIKASTEPAPLEDYLRRYPSGRFSELAQLQLDGILSSLGEKKVEIVSNPQNPYSKGSAKANTNYRVGDQFAYRSLDLLTKQEVRSGRLRVVAITDSAVIFGNGWVTDLLGNQLVGRLGRFSPNQIVPLEFRIGHRWTTRFDMVNKQQVGRIELNLKVATREPIVVPAGTFDAYKVEGSGWVYGEKFPVSLDHTYWYAPNEVTGWVARERVHRRFGKQTSLEERDELVSYRRG